MSRSRRFRAILKNETRAEADRRRRTHNQVALEFVLQRFLTRVFADPDSPWVLKGGTSLLARLPGARHSRDIDLLHRDARITEAVAELRELSQRPGGDPFRFALGGAKAMSGGVVRIKVEPYLDEQLYHPFSIDLSTELHLVTQVERIRPRPVVEIVDVDPLPEFALYPLPNQVADKVCALYEVHSGGAVSTRYRDLVDLVLITGCLPLNAAPTLAALENEAERRAQTLPSLPDHLHSPGPLWDTGYSKEARRWGLPPALADALQAAGECLDPLLRGHITAGTWVPDARKWRN